MDSQRQEIIYSMRKTLYPKECKIVGDSKVKNISGGYTERVSAQGGDKFSLAEVMDVLIIAAHFGLLIYDILKKSNKKERKPSYEEVLNEFKKIEINKNGVHVGDINIYQFIEQKMNDESQDGQKL